MRSSGITARSAGAARVAAAWLACAGCGFTTRAAGSGDAGIDGSGGGGDDAPPDDGAGTACYGPSDAWRVCLDVMPTNMLTLPLMIDTDSSELCLKKQPAGWMQAGQPDACFIVGDTISTPLTTTARTEVRGTRPLVLVAHTQINIKISLDVAGHRDENTKPPFVPAACTPFAQAPGDIRQDTGGGGGAGGTFAVQGGKGGAGDTAQAGEPGSEDQTPARLRAGCPGQLGGGQMSDPSPGRGGGAVYLVTAGTISIFSAINASGGGATKSSRVARVGGSGGGSGGMIVLYAQAVNFSGSGAAVVANGGGGAGGGSFNSGGGDGGDASITMPMNPAVGGSGGGGGDGGEGYPASDGARDGIDAPNTSSGGGGGGGGAGYIRSNVRLETNRVSPPADVVP